MAPYQVYIILTDDHNMSMHGIKEDLVQHDTTKTNNLLNMLNDINVLIKVGREIQ